MSELAAAVLAMSKITVMCMHSTHRFSISDTLEESVSSGEEEGGGGQNRSSNKARRDAFRRVASHAPRGPHAFEQARATRLASITVFDIPVGENSRAMQL